MRYFNFPSKKIFKKEVFSGKKKIFTLEYTQATFNEYLEYESKSLEEKTLEIYILIHSQLPLTFFEKFLKIIFKDYVGKLERKLNFPILIEEVLNNKYKIYESIFNDLPKNFSINNKGKKIPACKGLFSVSLLQVCSGYNISPIELFKNYTLEQFLYLSEGYTYNANLQTEEGIKINNLANKDKTGIKERAKNTKKAFEEAFGKG